jgi:4-amino-4-deoxy-L-arabinose transferase-like glycosyltransferase
MKLKQVNLALAALLITAALLRLVGLGSWPPSLYWEEAALGYDAYSLWHTGKDFHGNSWPIVAFESFGDFKPSGYFYAVAPFVGFFGLNNWSVRLPAALAGIATVYLVYLLGKTWFRREEIGLLAAMALAIMPWHIQFSRAAFEVTLATFWLVLGVYLLTKMKKQPGWILPAGIALVAAAYTYHGLRLLAPLMGLYFIAVHYRLMLKSAWLWLTGGVCFLLMLPLIINLTSPVVTQRFAETSLFSTSEAVLIANELREADGNTLIARMVHHRYWYWGREIVSGMANHLSPRFLFITGDYNQRHQTGYTGILYWWMALALIAAVRWAKKKESLPLRHGLVWIILAMIPPALTNLTPHTLRFLPAAPVAALLIGYGLYQLGLWLKAQKRLRLLSVILVSVIAIELAAYSFDYVTAYPVRSGMDWQYGYKEVVEFVKARNRPDELVQVTRAYGRPSIYFMYYLPAEPEAIQKQALDVLRDQGELLAFDNFRFGEIDPTLPGLAISDQPLATGELIEKIYFPNNQPAFYIYEL